MSKSTQSVFRQKRISATELRNTSMCLDALEKDPHLIQVVERRGRVVAHLVSAKFFEIQESMADGNTLRFELESPQGIWSKKVLVERLSVSDEALQNWRVEIDTIEYRLERSWANDSLEPDHTQLIWRHHPDVAQAVLMRFNSNDTLKDGGHT